MNYIWHFDRDPSRPTQISIALFLLYAFLETSLLIYKGRAFAGFFVYPVQVIQGYFILELAITAVAYLLMFFVAAKIAAGKNWARWMLLFGLFVIFIVTTCNMNVLVFGDAVAGLLVVGQVMVTALAAALLFQRPSNVWFTTGEYIQELEGGEQEPTPRLEPTKDRKNTKIWSDPKKVET